MALDGGLIFGGGAPHGVKYNAPIGGVELGGEADDSFTINVIPSGGIEFAGDVTITTLVSVTPTGGLSFAGGTPIEFGTIVTGGISLGGGAPITVSDAQAAEGLEFGGEAPIFSTNAPLETDGGIEFSGQALLSSNFVASGGINFGGEAGIESGVGFEGSGGLEFGGEEGNTSTEVNFETSGGLEFGGTATVSTASILAEATGGISLGATAPHGVQIAPDGGIAFGADAGISDLPAQIPTGGIAFGGSAPTSVSIAVSRGGIELGGGGRENVIPSFSLGPHRAATDLATILRSIRYHLADRNGVYPSHLIEISRDPDRYLEAPPGDDYALIVEPSESVDMRYFDGGGHHTDLRRVNTEIRCFHRLDLDVSDLASQWTADSSKGAIRRGRLVAKWLHDVDLPSSSGVILLQEPMRAVMVPIVARGRKEGWGFVSVKIEFMYREDVETVS